MPYTVTKVTLHVLGGTGLIGVGAADCDPYLESVDLTEDGQVDPGEDPIGQLMVVLPDALVRAQETWDQRPRGEAYQAPAPAQPAQPAERVNTQPTRRQAARNQPQEETQQAPRLF